MIASPPAFHVASRVRAIRMDRPVREAIQILSEPEIDALIVVEGAPDDPGAFLGILTERDIFKAMAERGLDVLDHLVWMLTTGDVVSVDVRASQADRIQAFCAHKTNHIAIMDGLCLHAVESIWDCVSSTSNPEASGRAAVA